jgi:hypothetical protein
MKCVCGHTDECHADRIYYKGPCILCACQMFDVAVIRMMRVNHRPTDELSKEELPQWEYVRKPG